MERGKYNRGRGMPRPRAYDGIDTTKNQHIKLYGISQR